MQGIDNHFIPTFELKAIVVRRLFTRVYVYTFGTRDSRRCPPFASSKLFQPASRCRPLSALVFNSTLLILLSSIDIGLDRVGSRLPLQGRCAILVRSGGDVWFFTKTLPFLGVVRYFSIISASLSCCFFPSLLCRLAFGPPSEPARRSEKEAAADETPDHENVVMCGGGKATHPTPPPPTTTSRVTHH